jgi:hypothetical protein
MKRLIALIAMILVVTGCSTCTGAVTKTPTTASASPTSTPPAAPQYPGLWPRSTSIAYDSTHGNVVLLGGLGNRSAWLGDTWIWRGGRWIQQKPAANPPARLGAALVDDPEMHAVLLFGGQEASGTALDDTWAWNGLNWIRLSPAHSPSPRYGAAIAFDPVRHVVLLFGGSSALNDTWTWNGQDWTQANPPQSPPGRMYGRLAVDTARGEAVLFGGFEALQDTWTWDGATWTQQHPNNTPPGIHEATPFTEQMVYDSAMKVVIFVGPSEATNRTEIFTWNGDWTKVDVASPPAARDGAGLAYDAADSITILAGGYPLGTPADVSTTWGWNGTSWSALG